MCERKCAPTQTIILDISGPAIEISRSGPDFPAPNPPGEGVIPVELALTQAGLTPSLPALSALGQTPAGTPLMKTFSAKAADVERKAVPEVPHKCVALAPETGV